LVILFSLRWGGEAGSDESDLIVRLSVNDALRHEDIGIDTGFVAEPGLFEDCLDDLLGV
jgi:hypothetical protein